jgi:hypothetical protein
MILSSVSDRDINSIILKGSKCTMNLVRIVHLSRNILNNRINVPVI